MYFVYVFTGGSAISFWIFQTNFPRGRKNPTKPCLFWYCFPLSLCLSVGRADEWRIGAEPRHVTPQLSPASAGGNGLRCCSGTARAALEISHPWQMTALGRSTASLCVCGTFVQHCSDTVTAAAAAVAPVGDRMAISGQKKSQKTFWNFCSYRVCNNAFVS